MENHARCEWQDSNYRHAGLIAASRGGGSFDGVAEQATTRSPPFDRVMGAVQHAEPHRRSGRVFKVHGRNLVVRSECVVERIRMPSGRTSRMTRPPAS